MALIAIAIQDSDVLDLCYFRAVHLLSDPHDYVRQAAVRCAGEWGRMIATLKQEGHQRDWFDFVFLQICSTVRDMNVKVRVEAFTALGKFTCVSEVILLQALSKKVLVKLKDKQNLVPCRARQCKIHVANAAGAFIHGLEDEFNEVQQAACVTLRMLPVVSGQFAGEVFNIVSDLLNDDSIIVRLEALKTLHHMAVSGCLKMQEEHIEMSEADIFRALFGVGQNNGDHSVGIVDNFDHEESWEDFGENPIDYNPLFETTIDFETRDDAFNWAQKIAFENGFALVKANNGAKNRKKNGLLASYFRCKRHGKPKETEDLEKPRRSQKCSCKFRIRAVQNFVSKNDKETVVWNIVTSEGGGVHNHNVAVYKDGDRHFAGLDAEEKAYVRQQTLAGVQPRDIKNGLHLRSPEKPQPQCMTIGCVATIC